MIFSFFENDFLSTNSKIIVTKLQKLQKVIITKSNAKIIYLKINHRKKPVSLLENYFSKEY